MKPNRQLKVKNWPRRSFFQIFHLIFPLSLLVAFRGDTHDTHNYVDAFYETIDFPLSPIEYYSEKGMEWAFGLMSWPIHAMGLGPAVLFLIFSLGTFYFLNKAANRCGLQFIDVAPYYLGSYFLVQQFMQIRQGLGAAFSLSALVLIACATTSVWRTSKSSILAAAFHITSILPIITAQTLRWLMPKPSRFRIGMWLILIIASTILVARLFMSIDLIQSMGRLSVYAIDEEYNSERGTFDPANIRAALILLCLFVCASQELLRSRLFVLLLGIYAAHLGVRLGFFDFLILSGRLSSALGFVEVILIPLLVKDRIERPVVKFLIGVAYFALHAAITLTIQAPHLIEGYFEPIQSDYSAN